MLEERLTLTNSKRRLDRDLEALNRIRKEGEIEQLLIHLRREVEEIGLSPALKGEVPEMRNRKRANVVSESSIKSIKCGKGRWQAQQIRLGDCIPKTHPSESLKANTLTSTVKPSRQYIERLRATCQNYIMTGTT